VSWAININISTGGGGSAIAAKSVLLALAWYADPNGGSARPGRNLLSQHCGCDVSTVVRSLRHLERLGLIVKTRGASRYGAAEYRLPLGKIIDASTGVSVPPVNDAPPGSVPPVDCGKGGSVPPVNMSTGGSVQQKGGSVHPQYMNSTPDLLKALKGKKPLDGFADVEGAWVNLLAHGHCANAQDRSALVAYCEQHGVEKVIKALHVLSVERDGAKAAGRDWRRVSVRWVLDRIKDLSKPKARKRQTITDGWRGVKESAVGHGSLSDRLKKGDNAR
jgi:hypothetical protein